MPSFLVAYTSFVVGPERPKMKVWIATEMGGEGAQLTTEESAANLLKLIDKLDVSSTGRFLAWNGKELAW